MSEPKKLSNVIPIEAREAVDPPRSITRRQLINRLNFINFQDQFITARFQHSSLPETLAVQVKPQPCANNVLDCLWDGPESRLSHLIGCTLQDMCIVGGRDLTTFVPELIDIGEFGLRVHLPESGSVTCLREEPRYSCKGVQAQLIQHSAHFFGNLLNFNSFRFQVALKSEPPQTFAWIRKDNPVLVILGREQDTLYTSECRIVGHRLMSREGQFTLEPMENRVRRFDTKEFRSERHRLVPTPRILFRHPFSGHLIQREVIDLSGSGFSVMETISDSVLLPGLILPSVELNLANTFRIRCKAQVVYRIPLNEENPCHTFRCGLALLDIDIEDHTNLLALLSNIENHNCYICNRIDLDVLWDFFFESGFIYPQKYSFLQINKEKIKETYDRLYNKSSTIARHFTYQEGTRILGHIAMVRFYTNAWLIQHHAGNTAASTRAGLEVLNRIGHFTYECHRFHSIHMNYLIGYYRQDNKFPNRVFGRITRNIGDKQGSSIDSFAYCHYKRERASRLVLPDAWTLEESGAQDLKALAYFYRSESGGLMIDALDLTPESIDLSELNGEYAKVGFRRERFVFSLKMGGRTHALIVADIADIGLNLSELTSSVKVFFLDTRQVSKEILNRALHHIAELYLIEDVPILIYPAESAKKLSFPIEKFYYLWIMNTAFSDHYFRHLNRMLRFIK
jgi:hypothetical protein